MIIADILPEDEILSGETIKLDVVAEHAGERLDKTLVLLCDGFSRSRLQALIGQGHVRVNGASCTASSRKMEAGDRMELDIPPLVDAEPKPENIPLDIVFEDSDILVINKPVGMVVHPGAGNHTGTLVNALLAHCGDTLSGIGGVARPGIVHRLDKDTSGLMVAAKNDRAHQNLSAQLESRTLTRIYHAVIFKVPFPPKGTVDQPIGRHAQHRLKMSIDRRAGREARTHYQMLENFDGAVSLVECRLETGRTHQIRVHMESLGHPLLGDVLYGPQPTALKSALGKAGHEEAVVRKILAFPRQALHAKGIRFDHPITGAEMSFEREPPEDILNLLNLLNKKI
ncbi:MAG: RluA family pseudouridine synthase [Alphaproteobacteria bacterium]